MTQVESIVDTAVAGVAAAPHGDQNNALHKGAVTIGGLVGVGALTHDAAESLLLDASSSHRDGSKARLRTIRSGLKWGLAHPFDDVEDSPDFEPVVNDRLVQEMREQARAREREADAHREQARKHLVKAEYCERVAAALWVHAEAVADLERRKINRMAAQNFALGFDMWPVPVQSREYRALGTMPSIVIPWTVRGDLRTTQYRHLGESDAKYHWHDDMGAGKLFNADAMLDPHDKTLLIVEGALNAVTLWSHGFTSVVGLPHKHAWKPEYKRFCEGFDRVVFVPDPDAKQQWRDYARQSGAALALLPKAPDDFLVDTDPDVLARWLRYAEL